MTDDEEEEAERREIHHRSGVWAIVTRQPPAIGEVFTVPYPFSRDTWLSHHNGDEGPASNEVPTWKPGPRNQEIQTSASRAGYDSPDVVSVADAMGGQIITVVGVYRPRHFPTRVFYTRQWRDPDGKVFGKTNCRMTTATAFRTLTQGYRHEFELIRP